jgi:RNA polymerase sigma-70 factor (sigma-E family)
VAYADNDFEALYADEADAMSRLAYLMLGSAEPAKEVVHDAFARVYERWDRVDNPGAYLRTCVVNGCRDRLRRRGVERRHRPDQVADAQLGAHELLDALAHLPHRQRAVVVLRFYEDRSVADIASLLGLREGTVKSHLHRGLNRLREDLGP